MRYGLKGTLVVIGVAVWLLTSKVVCGQVTNDKLRWVGSWAASQQVPETQNSLDPQLLRDATLRQIVHLSVGGDQLRVRVSNAFGTEPLHLTAVHVARPVSAAGAAIDAASDTQVMFNGSSDVMIPAGADKFVFLLAPCNATGIWN